MIDAAAPRPESVILGRDPEVLSGLLGFYARPGSRVLDATANRRRMWSGLEWSGEIVFMDIDQTFSPDVVGDFRAMPFPDASFDVIVFDPPHLPAASASAASKDQMVRDYGLASAPHGDNVSTLYKPFLVEALRVLKSDGLVFAKLKDYVHNHRYQWSLCDFIGAVRDVDGLTACDLRIKRDPCGGNLKSGRWQKSHHARNVHCWWVVVRKGRCEPRSCK